MELFWGSSQRVVPYLCWFEGGFRSGKEEMQLAGCRQVELDASFESGKEEQCVSPVGWQDFYWSLKTSSLLLRGEEDIYKMFS